LSAGAYVSDRRPKIVEISLGVSVGVVATLAPIFAPVMFGDPVLRIDMFDRQLASANLSLSRLKFDATVECLAANRIEYRPENLADFVVILKLALLSGGRRVGGAVLTIALPTPVLLKPLFV